MSRLTFHDKGTTRSGLTRIWAILNGDIELGNVSWFANWRRYTFSPLPGRTFDAECLTEITWFLGKVTNEHNRTTEFEQ